MSEEKKRINVYIPNDIYVKVTHSDYTLTEAVTFGLEKLLEPAREEIKDIPIENIEPKLLEAKDVIIKGLEARINDLNDRISSNEEQIKVKDTFYQDQLKTKDNQISELIKAQAVHIQTLLNQKVIEAPATKKRWFEFWK